MLSKLKIIHQTGQLIETDNDSFGSDNSHESFDETMKKDDQDYHDNLSRSSSEQIDNVDNNVHQIQKSNQKLKIFLDEFGLKNYFCNNPDPLCSLNLNNRKLIHMFTIKCSFGCFWSIILFSRYLF